MKPFRRVRRAPVLLVFLAALLAAGGAEARTKLLDSWQHPDPAASEPGRIAVIAVLPDALLRKAVEIDMAKLLEARNREVVVGSELPGLGQGIRGKIDTEKATAALKEAGIDAVIVMFYAGGAITGEYERSDYWLRYEGTGYGYGYYNWGAPYFVDVYSVQQGAGYADFQRTVWVETSFYDLNTEEAVWRIVTETKDVEHSDAVKGISRFLKRELRKAGQ